ncbi:MAG: FKBP-type peptidyl-prolyl cis-trans isomerase [Chlamydiae bacterium]|nr:FKBP-type peptidyl-prolyl cis-trans isomerase [Chlamydiota bacterium]
MQWAFRVCACLIFFCVEPISGENQEVKAFLCDLKPEDRILLEDFFRILMRTIQGFVICGDKPMGLMGYLNTTVRVPSSSPDASILVKGKELWQRLKISPDNKEYFFAIFDACGYCNLMAINRRAFLRAVDDNISLFRYALGPTLTAEKLLQSLIDANDDFYKVFKDDNVLFGILMGYGTQNALLCSRSELLCCDRVSDQKEIFPFLPYLLRIHRPGNTESQICAALGYQTVAEELDAIHQRVTLSHHNPPMTPYEIPYFICEKDSDETKNLLAIYMKNQKVLLEAVERPDFLEKIFTKFVTTTSGKIEIPEPPEEALSTFVASREDCSTKLADLLAIDVSYVEKRARELCIRAYTQGLSFQMEHETEPVNPDFYDANWRDAFLLDQDLVQSENLQEADDYFCHLAVSRMCECLVPEAIYYRVLKKGREAISSKMKKVSFHYSYKICGSSDESKPGTVRGANLEQFIPGIARILMNMRRGEIRWVAIHPKYGYGNTSFFPPNSTLLAKLELLDFEEGETDCLIASPYELERKDVQGMQEKFESLKKQKYYEKGRELASALQRIKKLIDPEIVEATVEAILSRQRKCPFKTIREAHQYSVDFQAYLNAQR